MKRGCETGMIFSDPDPTFKEVSTTIPDLDPAKSSGSGSESGSGSTTLNGSTCRGPWPVWPWPSGRPRGPFLFLRLEFCLRTATDMRRMIVTKPKTRACICKPFKESFLAWRACTTTLKGSVNFYKYGLYAGFFKQSMGARNRIGIGLSDRPVRLHRLAEMIPRNRFLGTWKV